MKSCAMVVAIGDNEWISAGKQYAWPVIEKYFKGNGHDVHLITDSKFLPDVPHPSWLRLRCHDILPGYDYILTWDLDNIPVKLDDDIFDTLDPDYLGYIKESDGGSKTYPHFYYALGVGGVPKAWATFYYGIYLKWRMNPKGWPSMEQYYVNMEIGNAEIEVAEIDPKYGFFYGAPGYEGATSWHYTFAFNKQLSPKAFKDHYNRIFK